MPEQISKRKLWLPDYIKVVEGKQACCLINLDTGDCILINHYAKKILKEFRNGNILTNILDKFDIPQKKRIEFNDFIHDSIKSGLLHLKPAAIDEGVMKTKVRTNISSYGFSLTLELLNHCNLKCIHCYNLSSPNKSESLELETISTVFISLEKIYPNLTILTLSGGEPFLYRHLNQVIENAKKCGFKKIRINTNGTIRPPQSTIILLKQNDVEIQVSMLGTSPQTHDSISTKIGSFAKTLNNIMYFKSIGLNISIAFIISKQSINSRKEAIEMAHKYDVPITFGDLFPMGRAAQNFNILKINDNTQNANHYGRNNIFSGKQFSILPDDKWNSMLEKFPPELPCGKSTLSISSNGDVLPCTQLQGVRLGNIHNDHICDILGSANMAEFREKIAIENRPVCSMCELRYVCSNKCPAVSFHFAGKLNSKSPYCNYY